MHSCDEVSEIRNTSSADFPPKDRSSSRKNTYSFVWKNHALGEMRRIHNLRAAKPAVDYLAFESCGSGPSTSEPSRAMTKRSLGWRLVLSACFIGRNLLLPFQNRDSVSAQYTDVGQMRTSPNRDIFHAGDYLLRPAIQHTYSYRLLSPLPP